MSPYHIALHACVDRYRGMTTDQTLLDFLDEFEQGCIDEMPLCKLNRWIGYIQGVLIERGATTVTAERDWTRPLFRPLDFP
jgi:hypothetical protein